MAGGRHLRWSHCCAVDAVQMPQGGLDVLGSNVSSRGSGLHDRTDASPHKKKKEEEEKKKQEGPHKKKKEEEEKKKQEGVASP